MKKLRIGLAVVLAGLLGFQPVAAMSEELAPTPSPRIIGGTTASISQVPWQVALIDRTGRSDYQGQFCGGSILNATWILTAAHCLKPLIRPNIGEPYIYQIPVKDLMVLAGTDALSASSLNGIRAKRYIVHEAWRPLTNANEFDYDIALIELEKPISLRVGRSQAIALPSFTASNGNVAMISGWGATESLPYTQFLRKANVNVMGDDYCSIDIRYPDLVDANMVCATGVGFSTDTCYGDSGGPLAIQNEFGTWEVHGITSFGSGCAEAPYPGVYTEVEAFVSWISPYILKKPTVTSLSPTSVPVGATVTINGRGFTGTTSVRLGSTEVEFNPVSDSQITFDVPEGSFTAKVRVENAAGFTVYSRSLTILPPPGAPEITKVSTSARIGRPVTISGRNLSGTTAVTINGVAQAFTIRNDRQIRFTVAPGTTSGTVVVTNAIGSTESDSTIQIR